VYVAFQGTKHLSDWAANLSVRHATVWRRGSEQERQVRFVVAVVCAVEGGAMFCSVAVARCLL